MRTISNRSRLLGTTLIAGMAAVMAAPAAFAQTDTSTDAKKKDEKSQDVVVTGSRLKRSSFTSPDPITVITSEQANLAGYADTASLLQQSSIAAGSVQTNDQLTGFVVTGGPGAKTLNLRGLGANRVIILLDGKRLGPAGVGGTVGPVDLNVIPQQAISSIEFLKNGASSVYGSDAVAGVVNIITKKNRDGGELSAYTQQSETGGGNVYTLSGDFGKTFDKGYVEISGEYYEQERLARGQRDYTNCNEDYLFDPKTGARVDYTDTVTPNEGHFYKCYNQLSNMVRTGSGDYQYLQPGVIYPDAAHGNNVPGTISAALGGPLNTFFARQTRNGFPDTFPYAQEGVDRGLTDRVSIVSPDRHFNLNANVGYDVNAWTHLYGQFQYSERLSSQQGSRQLFPTLGSAWVAGNPNNVFAGTGVTPVFPVIQLPSDNNQDVKYYRGVVGVKGDFHNLGWFDRFNYDVFAVYSKSSATYGGDSIYNDRVLATTTSASACNPAVTNLSNFDCSALGTGIPWLSKRVLAGGFTKAESDFLFFKRHSTTDYDQYILEADVSGDLFTLPAGAVSGAFGASYRHDKIDDKPDNQIQIGNLWGQTAAGHTAGSDSVKELFAELVVPVLKNVPFIQNLNFDVSGRYSDYDSYGSTTTYKAAGNWTVNPDLRFRASVGTSFRAPALYELYLAHQTSFQSQQAVDPCFNYGTSGVSIIIQNACSKLGIPANYNGVQNPGGGATAQISTGGGIGTLKAETSQAKSIGVVLTPKHFGIDRWAGLEVSVDYVDIQVHNEVNTFGTFNIISQCLQGQTGFCSLFTRDLNPSSPTYFNILTANNNYVNVARQGVRGLDLAVRGKHDFGKWGVVAAEANVTWTFSNKTLVLGSTISDNNGTTYGYAGPDVAGNAQIAWSKGDWTFFWNIQGIGKGSDTEVYGSDQFTTSRYTQLGGTPPVLYYKQYVETTIYHDFSVRKRFPQYNADLIVGVRNAFYEEPPAQSSGQLRSGISALNAYDMIGRSYFARITKRW